ncbi:hypothetical protein IFM89_033301 [Coptis chinensis]|uniref:SWIM-type domain-containing protein n=1 Tax=Coptis chinensis TaxID=261450 RepID=A0A835HH61_9MAGN|nr:hypothetical protein IFM89_033301 [Coptis chinensis]
MASCFNTTQVHVDGKIVTYIVKVRMVSEKGERWVKEYEVFYNGKEIEVQCICNLFNFKGILCRHALSALNNNEAAVSKEHYKVALEALAEAMNKVKQVEGCELRNTPTSTPPGAIDDGVKVQDPVRSKRVW